ncbi:beta-lactamase family protein [Archangium minus]|uniref:Beta-lactamase family protein n=1 Tax=Archangium minus TaxID=83450 RepID=A0ABY9XBE7_9BACT|nr:beta-lactamase family protein [Archangium minus]
MIHATKDIGSHGPKGGHPASPPPPVRREGPRSFAQSRLTPRGGPSRDVLVHRWCREARGRRLVDSLGVGLVTSRSDVANVPGRYGWDGAFGTSWYVDPKEQLVGVLMIQRRPDFLRIPNVTLDFWTSAYQLIDD